MHSRPLYLITGTREVTAACGALHSLFSSIWCAGGASSSPCSMTAPSSQLSKTLRRMLVRTQALVEAGVIEQPNWLDAVTRSAPTPCTEHAPALAVSQPVERLQLLMSVIRQRRWHSGPAASLARDVAPSVADDRPRCRCPPEPLVKGHRPKKLTFPEDPLVQSYMTRHPEAKLTPIFLNGSPPAPARVFAERQLQLMQARCVAAALPRIHISAN